MIGYLNIILPWFSLVQFSHSVVSDSLRPHETQHSSMMKNVFFSNAIKNYYEDLQDLLELIHKKDVLFIIGDWNAKVGSQETPGVTGKFGFGRMKQGKG